MILSKIISFATYHRSTTILLRKYSKSTFRPFIMPKDNKLHVMELQKARKRQKSQATKYLPSHIFLQVICNGTRAESRSVLLVTDHTNYLFNCGEGTQRLASEHHAKLTKIEHIFVTQPTWENIGGIPGVALTIQDTGVPKVNLHGPDGTMDIIQAVDNFVTLNQLEVLEADIDQQFSDQTMTVNYISIKNPYVETIEPFQAQLFSDRTNYYDYQHNCNGKRPRSPPNKQDRKSLKSNNILIKNRIDSMMIYVCKVHPRVGALNMEKCVDAGIKTGPLLGRLKSGQDITLPDGTVIKSKDMVSPAEPGPLFIVLECPDENWMDLIVKNQDLVKYQKETAAKEEEVASCILHFTPTKILNNPKYKEWMDKFGPKCQHLVINEDNTGFASEAMHKMQHQLNLIHPTIFPFFEGKTKFVDESNMKQVGDGINTYEKILAKIREKEEQTTQEIKEDECYHRCRTMDMFHLRPNKGLDTDLIVQLHPKSYRDEVFANDGFMDALAELQTELHAREQSLGDLEEYPKILMLGTGSSIPNKVRNTSGILLQLDKERSIILDCGEGTLGQIVRFFGEEKADEILKTIKAIYVSHLHADHHLGLIRILKQRERVTDERLFLLAPQQISPYLHFYHNRFENILNRFILVSNRDLLMGQNILSSSISKDLYATLDIAEICTSFVTHCPFAYGVAITLKDGKKIVYSGDTMPCDNMVKLAENSFLLIHEATMEDGLENEATVKRHSTISQAINTGVKANVNFTFLTHFSQRYSKIPVLPDKKESGIDFNRVGIAYDFMQFSLSQLSLLPLFEDSLKLMFQDFRAMLEERANKREWKKEQLVKEAKN